MSYFIPDNSCTSPTLSLRGLEVSITSVIIFMTLLQQIFSSDIPSAEGTGLLSKGYRHDKCDRGSNVRCAVLFAHRQNACVCFTFVKFLLMSTGKASPAGSFSLSVPSLSALAMRQLRLGESLLGQGERNQGAGQKGDPYGQKGVFPTPESAVSFFIHANRWEKVSRSAPCTDKTLNL